MGLNPLISLSLEPGKQIKYMTLFLHKFKALKNEKPGGVKPGIKKLKITMRNKWMIL